MVRKGAWKLVHFVGYPPQLFDLSADPYEERDLAGDSSTAEVQRQLYDALHRIVDPEAVNQRVFADQRDRIEQLGGCRGNSRASRLQFHAGARLIHAGARLRGPNRHKPARH